MLIYNILHMFVLSAVVLFQNLMHNKDRCKSLPCKVNIFAS